MTITCCFCGRKIPGPFEHVYRTLFGKKGWWTCHKSCLHKHDVS